MKAAVINAYGPPDVVEIKDVEAPSVRAGEVLVRVEAGTVAAPDWRFRRAEPFLIRVMLGLTRPARDKVLGFEFAGTIEQVGAGVTRFAPGDAVFGAAGIAMGAHAELLRLRDTGSLQPRPASVSSERAAALPYAGVTALHFLRKAMLTSGQKVLIYGASGGVGTAMVQLAKHLGAHVTGVVSARNQDFLRALGADETRDYARDDFSAGGAIHDVVVDVVGKAPFSRCVRALKRGGVLIQVAPSISDMLRGAWTQATGRARVVSGVASGRPGDMATLAALTAQGALNPPIEARFALEDIAEAHRLSESGRKRGHVVVLMR